MNLGYGVAREHSSKLIEPELSKEIIGADIEVHRHLGPGLLESAYEVCLSHELASRNIRVRRQVKVPVLYKGVALDCGYKIDILVEDKIVLELKAIEGLLPVHEAQLLTYMRLRNKKLGFLMNFHVARITSGIKRRVL